MKATCTKEDCDRPVMGRGLCSRHYQHARYHGELPDQPEPRRCDWCGKMFSDRKWNARYCSRLCNEIANHKSQTALLGFKRPGPYRGPKPCEQCGKPLPEYRRIDMRFCGRKCHTDHHNAEMAAARLAAKAATPRLCRGCTRPIPPGKASNALYCSESCKIASRRHEAYGLTKQELDVLLAQHEQCAICGTAEWGRKGPQVDHCHQTGRVRGVLCINCNNGLGRFADDPVRLRAAAAYLEAAAVR